MACAVAYLSSTKTGGRTGGSQGTNSVFTLVQPVTSLSFTQSHFLSLRSETHAFTGLTVLQYADEIISFHSRFAVEACGEESYRISSHKMEIQSLSTQPLVDGK